MPDTITSTQTVGITLTPALDPLTITATGTIAAATTGVYGGSSQSWSVYNAGLVRSTGGLKNAGMAFDNNAFVSNSGTINASGNYGILFKGQTAATSGTVSNSGTISGADYGVKSAATGTVTNSGTSSLIEATSTFEGEGVNLAEGGTVSNAGTISGFLYGVREGDIGLSEGDGSTPSGFLTDSVTNSGLISGLTGVSISADDAATVVNSGTIDATAGRYAVQFVGGSDAAADRLILIAGSVLEGAASAVYSGILNPDKQTNTVELQGGVQPVGTLNNFGAFTGFNNLQVDAGANWLLASSGTVGAGITISDAGTLAFQGSLASTVTLQAGASFDNQGSIEAPTGVSLTGVGTVTNEGTISGTQFGVVDSGPFDTYYLGRVSTVTNS